MSLGSPVAPMMDAASGPLRRQLVETLREQIARWEKTRRPQEAAVSSGFAALDELLPGGGFHRGTLVEWLAAGDGSGAASLALLAAREACLSTLLDNFGPLVVLDRSGEFYPPAAVRLGIEPQALIVVRVTSEADHVWALDQVLRCPAVAAVVAWPERLEAKTFRRLQLAAEQGGTLGLLVRPEQVRHEPSWAEVRLWVEAVGSWQLAVDSCQLRTTDSRQPTTDNCQLTTGNFFRFLQVQLLRSRGGASGGSVEVKIGNETRAVHLAPQLARATARRRAAGA